MAIKLNGKFYSGLVMLAGGGERYGPVLPDVRDDKRYPEIDCKYCNAKNVQPFSSYENVLGLTVQALCPNCGAGLTPSVKI